MLVNITAAKCIGIQAVRVMVEIDIDSCTYWDGQL